MEKGKTTNLMEIDEDIQVFGAEEHNLKNIDVRIPKNKLTVVTGVSGSGKSSLVIDTIAKESKRQLFSTFSTFLRAKMEKLSKPKFQEIKNLRTVIVVDQKRIKGNARSTVGTITDIFSYIRLLYSRCAENSIGESHFYSFNLPHGMCKTCKGIGKVFTIDTELLLDKSISLSEGAIQHPDYKLTGWYFKSIQESKLFDMKKPLTSFTDDEIEKLLHSKAFKTKGMLVKFEGIINNLERRYVKSDTRKSDKNMKFVTKAKCQDCNGCRLNKEAREVIYKGKTIQDLCDMELDDVLIFLERNLENINKNNKSNTTTQNQISEIESKILNQLIFKIKGICDLGIGYLSLNRETSTLSGGEAQRIKLAKQLGSNLIGICYIFDEPSIGLAPSQISDLIKILQQLRDKGNTVIVIEHDITIIEKADYIIEIGEKSGIQGGYKVAACEISEFLKKNTLTSRSLNDYVASQKEQDDETKDWNKILSGETSDDDSDEESDGFDEDEDELIIEKDKNGRRVTNQFFEIKNANTNNLKNLTVKFPKGILVGITGIAGSGKSTLVMNHFIKKHKEAIVVDQFKIGKSSRSTIATYTKVFDFIRALFGKANKKKVSLFSFNSKGACAKCKGRGVLKVDMHFLDDAETECDECEGKRFSDSVLEYEYKGKNISEVLNLTVDEALEFFRGNKEIRKRLQTLVDVGLPYVALGQTLSTLSGGETQRLKLGSHLHRDSKIFVLDEPSLGLHDSDLESLKKAINKLVEKQNTVVLIEHNMDLIACCDYVIELGPEGGKKGGLVVFKGKPEDLIKNEVSKTAKYLKTALISRKRKRNQQSKDEKSKKDDSNSMSDDEIEIVESSSDDSSDSDSEESDYEPVKKRRKIRR